MPKLSHKEREEIFLFLKREYGRTPSIIEVGYYFDTGKIMKTPQLKDDEIEADPSVMEQARKDGQSPKAV